MKKLLFLVSAFSFVVMSFMSVSCSKKSDPTPDGPTITIIAPLDTASYLTGPVAFNVSCQLTSGSNLSTLSASVAYQSELKALAVVWAPGVTTIDLNNTPSQLLTDRSLFSTISADAKSGIYILTLVVTDSTGKTAQTKIPFKIL